MEVYKSLFTTEDETVENVLFSKNIIPKGKIMQISVAYFKPNQSCPKHEHYDLHEVFVCDKGSIYITVDDKTVFMNEGDVVIVRPHHQHELINKESETCEMICIGIACPEN